MQPVVYKEAKLLQDKEVQLHTKVPTIQKAIRRFAMALENQTPATKRDAMYSISTVWYHLVVVEDMRRFQARGLMIYYYETYTLVFNEVTREVQYLQHSWFHMTKGQEVEKQGTDTIILTVNEQP